MRKRSPNTDTGRGDSHRAATAQRGVGDFFIRYGILFVAIILFATFSLIQPRFTSPANVFTILRQTSILGLMALGLNIIIIIGEFDISFEAITVFCGIIPVILIMQGLRNVPLVWLIALGFGLGLSLINAVNVIYGGVPSFIATLGMMTVLAGISLGLTHGDTTYPATYPGGFEVLGRWLVGGLIPFPVIVFLVGAILVVYLLDYRPLGRRLYAIGGNPQTSVHVGIRVKRLKLIAFLAAGALYAVAGITLSSMLSSCNSNMGKSFFLPAITTCFLGATFITEGVANPRGTIVASLLLAILVNGFFITNVAFYGQDIIQGIILIVAVGILVILKQRQTA